MDHFPLPVTDELVARATGTRGRVIVYLLNGRAFFVGAKAVLRRPVKRNGKWHVRDSGLVPLRAAAADANSFTT